MNRIEPGGNGDNPPKPAGILHFYLNKNINIFYGENAQGKTNIIESVFLASIGKSFRSSKDSELIKFGENYAKIEIDFHKSDRDGNIEIGISNKKNININKIKIKKS